MVMVYNYAIKRSCRVKGCSSSTNLPLTTSSQETRHSRIWRSNFHSIIWIECTYMAWKMWCCRCHSELPRYPLQHRNTHYPGCWELWWFTALSWISFWDCPLAVKCCFTQDCSSFLRASCITIPYIVNQFSSVAQSFPTLRCYGRQRTRPPCPSPAPKSYLNSCPSSRWCHPTISSSVFPLSCLQSFPASGSFQMSQFFLSGGQSIRVSSASASVLPMNIQDWFPLGWTGWISLLSRRLSRVFFNTTVQKHQFFCAQLSL